MYSLKREKIKGRNKRKGERKKEGKKGRTEGEISDVFCCNILRKKERKEDRKKELSYLWLATSKEKGEKSIQA